MWHGAVAEAVLCWSAMLRWGIAGQEDAEQGGLGRAGLGRKEVGAGMF